MLSKALVRASARAVYAKWEKLFSTYLERLGVGLVEVDNRSLEWAIERSGTVGE